MKVVVGLGNYGSEYARTYHNMGFLCVENIAKKLGVTIKNKCNNSLFSESNYLGTKVVLAEPQTYMNNSGIAVVELVKKFKIDLSDLIVVYDDIDIEKGTIRVREKGSGGTHNGMRDIVARLGSEEFARVRIGIGKPQYNLADYVLSHIASADKTLFDEAVENASDTIIARLK